MGLVVQPSPGGWVRDLEILEAGMAIFKALWPKAVISSFQLDSGVCTGFDFVYRSLVLCNVELI